MKLSIPALSGLVKLLNTAQRKAVDHVLGPLLIFAGAGSGKTRVVTVRAAKLIADGHALPEEIMLCTFTRKAAGEMRERLAKLLGHDIADRMCIGTMHSICAKLLKLGSKVVLLDEEERTQLLYHLVRVRLHPENDERLHQLQREVSEAISDYKNNLILPKEAHGKYADFYAVYQSVLEPKNQVDFDDLIMRLVIALRAQCNLSTLQALQQKYKFVFVDEYQDTNAAQDAFVRLLSDKFRNLCVVGDDDQAIYGWRGASVDLIIDFAVRYPSTEVVTMDENYRSWQNILDLAHSMVNKVARRGKSGSLTSMRSQDAKHNGELIDVFETHTDADEAALVCEKIEAMVAAGRPYSDIAVLYRTNAQSKLFEEELRVRHLPYVLANSASFYKLEEIVEIVERMHTLEEEMLASVGIRKCLAGYEAALRKPQHDDDMMIVNVRELLAIADRYKGTVVEFVSVVEGMLADEPDVKQNVIQLMTVHGAKGLEFPVVFVVGMEDMLFPTYPACKAGGDLMDEERRLAYVAVTRAQDTCIITYAQKRERNGEMREMQPSRFLRDIPARLLAVHRANGTPEPVKAAIPEVQAIQTPSVTPTALLLEEGATVFHTGMFGTGVITRVFLPLVEVRFRRGVKTIFLEEGQTTLIPVTKTSGELPIDVQMVGMEELQPTVMEDEEAGSQVIEMNMVEVNPQLTMF